MSGYLEMNIQGLDQIKANLNKISVDLRAKAADRITRAGAAVILKEAKRNVPVKTGTLKKSLGIVKLSRIGAAQILFAITNRTHGKFGGWYGHIVEFGGIKGSYPIKPTGKNKALAERGRSGFSHWVRREVIHPPSRAKPFLRPAFDEKHVQAVEAMRKRAVQFFERGR